MKTEILQSIRLMLAGFMLPGCFCLPYSIKGQVVTFDLKKFAFFCIFMIIFMMTSCVVYNPQTTDIPLIKGKNDLRIDAGISFVPSAHATISYGLTNKIAIQAFGSVGSDERKYFHIAPGIWKNFGNRTVMELYGGFGYGYGDAYRDACPGDLYGNYQLYFLQYNWGKYYTESGNIDFGFGIKTGYFHSDLTDHNYYGCGQPESADFVNYREHSILLEPMAVFRVGGDKVKFSLKAGYCHIFKLANPDNFIPAAKFNVGLGINFSPVMIKSEVGKQ